MTSGRVRLPDDAFYHLSRLAAPPLHGEWPVEEVRQFVTTITDGQIAEGILQRFYAELKPLCEAIRANFRSIPLGHGAIEGHAGTDIQWFDQLLDGLVSVFEYVLDEGDEEYKIVHAEALASKFRADVEAFPKNWHTKARTVAQFIFSTLRKVRRQMAQLHINQELLWRELASLQFVDADMLAWRLYCLDPRGPDWGNEMQQLHTDEHVFVTNTVIVLREVGSGVTTASLHWRSGIRHVSNRRIAHRRGFSLNPSSKPEFRVGSQQDSSFSANYDDLLKAHASSFV
ncbi:hypothetical protein JCM10295v2_002565 [Rhodotorula toruloides]